MNVSDHPVRGFVIALLCIVFSACQAPPLADDSLQIDYEKFTLDNGLEVVFHIDRSDPIVAVAMTYHVGSARELEGRTGFAHMFEHLLFLESENLGKGGLDILINKVGGSLNGSTSRDRTNYYQVVPRDALEKILWAEADKMGFFINTVTESVVAKEKQVVKNEKRQSVDNRPYGHTRYVIGKNLYPVGHPYNWQVIGSLEDLDRATLEDVRNFYNDWYGPNNATLVVAGDFDIEEAKAWVERYFGEFEPRGDVTPRSVERAELSETKKLYHEDNFARLPALTMVWPTVEEFHPDSYALDMLAELLASGKKSPFYKVLVEEKKMTPTVRMSNRGSELAGEFELSIRSFPETRLDEVSAAIDTAFARFEAEGISEKDLERIKAGQETSFYNRLSSTLGKAFQLAHYNIFAGDPGYVAGEIEDILAVTAEDVMRVYTAYIKGKPFVATSFVPKGQQHLALSSSIKADVVEEPIVQGAESEFVLTSNEGYQSTPSRIDRSEEPPFGSPPVVNTPETWTAELANGMEVYGIEHSEMPLVQFNLRLKGGLLLDEAEKLGAANFLAEMMTAGTAQKTPAELEEAIDQLGASINVRAGRESFVISGNTLARNFKPTMDLVREILLEPRWDAGELEIVRNRISNQLRQQQGSPRTIAQQVYNQLLYGDEHILSQNLLGTLASVESMTMEDLQEYYNANLSPLVADFHIAGAVDRAETMSVLESLGKEWDAKDVHFPTFPQSETVERAQVYFVDVPGAKQSVLRVGFLALPQTDPDFFRANIMNFKLGGGGFASELTQELREGKGYTYGIGSRFSGSDMAGPFTISSNVRSNVTLEALSLIKDIVETYESDFDEAYLDDTKSFLIKSNARRFETLGAKLSILGNISAYGWSSEYPKEQENVVRNITVEDVKELAANYLNADRMIYLVVGDAETQMARLTALGLGQPVLLDSEGRRVEG